MGCGCQGNGNSNVLDARTPEQLAMEKSRSVESMTDDSFVMCTYTHPNLGEHRVIGPRSGMDYGFRGGGAKFLVHKSDIEANPSLFLPDVIVPPPPVDTPPPPVEAIKDELPPEKLVKEEVKKPRGRKPRAARVR